MKVQRYGIFFTPRPGALAEFGAAWLGWSPVTGLPVEHPKIEGLTQPLSEITATPRKYGLHGTIKPPFALAKGTNADALRRTFDALCTTQAPVSLDGLQLTRLGSFIALTVDGDQTPLAEVAGTFLRELDVFRAAPSQAELSRRRKATLSPRQEAPLTQWGYPYVLDEFRFHLTLSGQLGADAMPTISALAPHLMPLLDRPFVIDTLTLVGEDENGMFHEVHRQALTG